MVRIQSFFYLSPLGLFVDFPQHKKKFLLFDGLLPFIYARTKFQVQFEVASGNHVITLNIDTNHVSYFKMCEWISRHFSNNKNTSYKMFDFCCQAKVDYLNYIINMILNSDPIWLTKEVILKVIRNC